MASPAEFWVSQEEKIALTASSAGGCVFWDTVVCLKQSAGRKERTPGATTLCPTVGVSCT